MRDRLSALARLFTLGAEGLAYGPALNTVSSAGTAIGAALAATTILAGDSFQVQNQDMSKRALLLNLWADVQVAGELRVRSPKWHDNVDGFRTATMIGIVEPLMPWGVPQRIYPQDVLAVDLAGSAVAGDVETISMLQYYDDLPGTSARFISPEDLARRALNILSVRNTITAVAGPGYSGSEAINAEVDLMKANTDYALIGYAAAVEATSVCWRGPDTGNLRVSGPAEPTLWHHTRNWFVRLSRAYGIPLIPVINSANKGATLVDCVQDENAAAVTLVSYYAELSK
jgi:hypothetical protein